MGAVANRLVAGIFAAAEMHQFTGRGAILLGRHAGAFMGSIAKWLACAFTAGAPVIILARFDFDIIGFFLCDDRICHDLLSSKPMMY